MSLILLSFIIRNSLSAFSIGLEKIVVIIRKERKNLYFLKSISLFAIPYLLAWLFNITMKNQYKNIA
ncbi:hypothetical protein CHR53_12090 [Neobacillus mesonae]|uniref:Uncharacterized protein n=1 Tax=Neobacillus mesonae TaxID=1193713 RepID=A0A3T0HXV1_9BACI|nr:hypothetical protein CHR53_12090 [Neobacillus mesonae]